MSGGTVEAGDRARARVGTVVDGKWTLDALLGIGGMAAVYAATHRNSSRAAIKILNPDIALNTEAKTRFLREGYVANNIGHPRVVLVQDDDEAPDGTVYLVMELLEGDTLQTLLANRRTLPPAQVLRVAREVLEVLEAAHAKGIVHRDLKPGNIMLMPDGHVKVLDFGVAKVRESTMVGIPNVTTLSPMGTPGFMPPEQARGRWDNVDGRADLWALGATMLALLTGRYVHEEETPNEQLLAAMTKPAPRLRELMPDAHERLVAVVDKSLAFDRDERFLDASAMKAAVDEALAALGEPTMRDVAPSSPMLRREAAASADPSPIRATPITGGASVADVVAHKPSSRRTVPIILATVGVVAIVVIVRALPRSAVDTPTVGSATATETHGVTSAPPTAILPAAVSPTLTATTEPEPATSATVTATGAKQPSVSAFPAAPPVKRDRSAANAADASAPPASSVDIFNRRR